ncbi:hypothetical protein [Streptomyces sioyaensis]|uniref:deazapurine DNA modification protein DpdA family protein n=1 Tax=Streptomyces sioyaensis TaxID=67364 RepID=UPI003717E5D5
MCEPQILAKTGQTVYDHQCRTVASYLNLMWHDDELPWMPVLQGWTLDDYLRCVDMYASMGVDLTLEPLVGLGSVCRRQSTKEALPLGRMPSPWREIEHGADWRLLRRTRTAAKVHVRSSQ